MADKYRILQSPAFASRLFETTQFAWLWAVLRFYLGYQWLTSGWGKVNNPAWVQGGAALKGYWTNAVRIPETGKPPITYDWYRNFLQGMLNAEAYTWFGPLIAWAEVLVGVALIVGLLTGFAAFGGALMNFNFMLAGSASTNPVLFLISVLLILAWKVAGYWGLDRWVLNLVGTPWRQPPPEPT